MIAAALLMAAPLPAKPQAQAHFDNTPGNPATTPAKPAAHAAKMHQTRAKAQAKTTANPAAHGPATASTKALPKTAAAANSKPSGSKKIAAVAKSKSPAKAAMARRSAKNNSKLATASRPKAPAPEPKPAEKPAALVPVAAPAREPEVAKRDPFLPLLYQHDPSGPSHLPPGVAGLMVSTVRIDGTVESQSGMIAVVSNPEQHVYFVREGDRLYDGQVEKIGPDGVTFLETSKDAFGKPVERTVTKRIYATAGEQQ